jgi:signal transduction histidine kinase
MPLTVLVLAKADYQHLNLPDLLGPGFSVSETDSTGASALSAAKRPDCVLLDCLLPTASTIPLLQEWVEAKIPVIALTNSNKAELATAAMKRGAVDYLYKEQMTADTVGRAIRYAIDKTQLEIELDRRRHELESFVSVASHDLKAPLRRLDQLSQMLLRDIEHDNRQAVRQDVDLILASTRQMNQLIDRLRQYTRAGQLQGPLGPVDMDQVFVEALANISATVDQARAEIKKGDLPKVHGHRELLVQLLQNLLANAVKYQQASTPQITVEAAPDEQGWRFSVSDNGIGIAPEHWERVFLPFKRLHTQKEYEGAGLGLSTCRKIIEHHGGRMWIESALDGGAIFHFTLQAAKATAPHRKLRLLLADDDAVNRMMASAILKKLGHQVEAVENGQQAIEALGTGSFDGVLLDLEMPVLSGIETARRIRSADFGPPPPSLSCCLPVMTASTSTRPERRALMPYWANRLMPTASAYKPQPFFPVPDPRCFTT